MQAKIMLSNRHIHLSREHAEILFGSADNFTVAKQLEGMYVPKETITVKGPKGTIENVTILLPCRGFTQFEMFRSDMFVLGVNAPLSESGDLSNAAELTLIGTHGELTLPCGIVALRHIHLGEKIGQEAGIPDGAMVKLKIDGCRAMVMEQVLVRYVKNSTSCVVHLDFEEGNAAWLKNGATGTIIKD